MEWERLKILGSVVNCAGMKKISRPVLIYSVLFSVLLNLTYADVLVQWDLPTSSVVTSVSATSTALGLQTGSLFKMGSGLVPVPNSIGWGGSTWTTSGTPLQASQDNNYFAFAVSPETGNDVLINGAARLVLYHSVNGPQFYDFLYSNSIDFSTYQTCASFALGGPGLIINLDVTDSLTFALAANPILITSGNTGYFRIVGYGAANTAGVGRIISNQAVDFGLNGSVSSSSIPEPSSLSLLALGGIALALRKRNCV